VPRAQVRILRPTELTHFLFGLVVDRHVTFSSLSLRKPDKSQIRAPGGRWWIPNAVNQEPNVE